VRDLEPERLVEGQRVGTLHVGRELHEVAVASPSLLDGPLEHERENDAETEIPLPTELQGIDIDEGTALVDLPPAFYQIGPRSGLLRLAQVVWTLTELPSINEVRFLERGREFAVVDQGGELVTNDDGEAMPVNRGHYSRFAPTSPAEDGGTDAGLPPQPATEVPA
jgi:spore germination protein GerM